MPDLTELRDAVHAAIAAQVRNISDAAFQVMNPPTFRGNNSLYIDVVILDHLFYEAIKEVQIKWRNADIDLLFSGAPLGEDDMILKLPGLDVRLKLAHVFGAVREQLHSHIQITDCWVMFDQTVVTEDSTEVAPPPPASQESCTFSGRSETPRR